jgi:hypothetical protein
MDCRYVVDTVIYTEIPGDTDGYCDEIIYRYFKVAHRDMVFLKFILEAYEGMNVMSTVDNEAGIIRISIMPGCGEDMEGLLADLGRQVLMEPVSWRG